jgi:prephenate dehydrogenase/chorismate mutase/prephenate dehydrogenase
LGVQVKSQYDVENADIVIASVPIEKTVQECRRLLKRMKPFSLLVDVASVKTGIVDRILPHLSENTEYLSLHPLFGPETESFKGENILAIDLRAGALTRALLNFLVRIGLHVTHVNVDEHDRKTAITQALHHFVYASLASVLTEFMKTSEIQKFSTRSLRKTIEIIRCIWQNADTILEIQRNNPYATIARDNYRKVLSKQLTRRNVMRKQTISAVKVLGKIKLIGP